MTKKPSTTEPKNPKKGEKWTPRVTDIKWSFLSVKVKETKALRPKKWFNKLTATISSLERRPFLFYIAHSRTSI